MAALWLLKKREQRPRNRVSRASIVYAGHQPKFLVGSTPCFLWWFIELVGLSSPSCGQQR